MMTRLNVTDGTGGIGLSVEGDIGTVEVTNPTICIRWCLSKALLEQITNINKNKPTQLLLIVRYGRMREGEMYFDTGKEDRRLCNIKEGMSFFPLRYSGIIRIATVLVASADADDVKNKYIQRTGYGPYGFLRDPLNASGESIAVSDEDEMRDDIVCFGAGSVDVHLPDGVFATRPRDWEWVNLWFSDPPRDQCALNRRRVMAYSIQPFVLVLFACIYLVLVSIGAFLRLLPASLGLGGRLWWSVLPHRWERDEPWEFFGSLTGLSFIDRCYFAPMWKGVRHYYLLAFSPMWLGVSYLPAFGFSTPAVTMDSIENYLSVWVWGLGLLLAVFLIHRLIMKLPQTSIGRLFEDASRRRQLRKEQEQREAERELLSDAYRYLTCASDDLLTPLEELPAERQTVRLRFSGFKREVCRPFTG